MRNMRHVAIVILWVVIIIRLAMRMVEDSIELEVQLVNDLLLMIILKMPMRWSDE